jgi:hypothetical protein
MSGRGLLAADVLLARLERHAVGRVAVDVDRHAADDAPGACRMFIERREKRRVRPP